MRYDGKAAMGSMVRKPKANLASRADLFNQGPALDPNFATLQLSSTPSGLNRGSQVGSDILSSPPSIRRRSSKARTASSDHETLAVE